MDVLDKFIQAEAAFCDKPSSVILTEDILMFHSERSTGKKKEELAFYFKSLLGSYFNRVIANNVSVELRLKVEETDVEIKKILTGAMDVLRKYYGDNVFTSSSIDLSIDKFEFDLIVQFNRNMVSKKLLNKLIETLFASWRMVQASDNKYYIVCHVNIENLNHKQNHVRKHEERIDEL